ncbi:MAG: pilus assembly protein [Kribbellaceae bacterium]|nr:pilus assembly protein [Kribbellaceae bacterium]
MSRHPYRGERDQGSAPVELAIVAPFLLVISGLVIGFGRVEKANLTATGTAAAAARAASLARTPAAAEAAARSMVQADHGSCPNPQVKVDTTAFHPGGLVKVSVVCQPSLAELTAIGLPGHLRLSSTMASGIDKWREADSR